MMTINPKEILAPEMRAVIAHVAAILKTPYIDPNTSAERNKIVEGPFGLKKYFKERCSEKKYTQIKFEPYGTTCQISTDKALSPAEIFIYQHTDMGWNLDNIQRPNHNIVHTLRVFAYIPFIVEMLKKYGGGKVHDLSVEKIQILALFSVIGRLNEHDWFSAQATYEFFRWRAGAIFAEYFKEPNLWPFESAEEVLEYRTILEAMGDLKNNDPRHIALSISHKLDLARCWEKKRYDGEGYDGIGRKYIKDHIFRLNRQKRQGFLS